jgi:predicted metalloendopeptidase
MKTKKNKFIYSKTMKERKKNKTIYQRHNTNTQNNPLLKNDYYSFINHPWINSHSSQQNTQEINIFIEMQDHVNDELVPLVQQSKSLKKIYDSVLRTSDASVEKNILEQIDHLHTLCSQKTNVYTFLVWLSSQGFISPVHYDVEEDPKNNQYFISTLEGGGQGAATSFTLDDKNAYKNPKIKRTMIQYYQRLFSVVLGENHPYNVASIFDIERSLIQKTMNVVETFTMSKIYHKYNPEEVKTHCDFDLHEFSKQMGIKTPSYVLVQNPRYIRFAMRLLKTWNNETWRPYWVYQIIKMATSFHTTLYKIRKDFLSQFYIINPEKTKEKRALSLTKIILNSQLNKQYLASYKKVKERKYAITMINIIKKVLKERIQKNGWLHPSTKSQAIEKLERMYFAVGWKEEFEPDPTTMVDFSPDDGFKNLIFYNQWNLTEKCKREGKQIPSRAYWLRDDDLNTFDVNAFYNANRNELILPNAILTKPFTDTEKSAAYNFAQLGTTIGHEMMHAFDSEGYQYDEKGNYRVWWTDEDRKRYRGKQESVKRQYEEFAKRDNYKIPAELNMGENIADISGFLLAEDALCHYLKIEKGEKEEEIAKALHEFYFCYAKQWRSTLKATEMCGKIDNNLHTISKYRVNCVLSRSRRFQELYGIQKGDGMYYDTTNEIW